LTFLTELGLVADSLDVVAVGSSTLATVIIRAINRPDAPGAIICPVCLDNGHVEGIYSGAALGAM
jgi:hypothetical protein